ELEFQHGPSVEGLLAEPLWVRTLWVGIPQAVRPQIEAARGLRRLLSHHGPPDVNVFKRDNRKQQNRS
ncbi:hypothetical protein DPEC_G00023520, partial [Dallia pectoralis]